jgi:outer membrane lipoprotein LolB
MKRLTVISVTGLLLAGCVSMSTTPQPAGTFKTESTTERQTQAANVTSWNASGAVSIQQGQQQPLIMRYDWQQSGPDHYHINLAASLNLAAVTITGTPSRVTLQKGNEPPVSAATPEQLMQRNLGWSLPVPSLWYWARGLPAPGPNQGIKYDQYGHLVYLQQNGWRVSYQGYQTVNGVDLPQIVELHRGDISARIVFKQWAINK